MILRYFYVEQYSEIAPGLDVNLGGRYKFYYHKEDDILEIIKTEKYVKNLYNEYDVISDVSAILGKNSAGKTTILRMINSIFNGFGENDSGYIVVFECEEKYIFFTSINHLQKTFLNLNKPIEWHISKRFDAIDEFKDIGLVYFSNIFDKATPFQGNSNLIDISTNYSFETFYRQNGKKILNNRSILDEYKRSCILQEISFFIDMQEKGEINEKLLFEIPKQINVGLVSNYSMDTEKNYTNKEMYQLLEKIYKILNEYYVEIDKPDAETFKEEMLFYLLYDQLYIFLEDKRGNISLAINSWIAEIDQKNYFLSSYYNNILNNLLSEDPIEDDEVTSLISIGETHIIEHKHGNTAKFLGDIIDKLYNIEVEQYEKIISEIVKIKDVVSLANEKFKVETVCHLNNAIYNLQLFMDDLKENEYDIYNLSLLDDVIEELQIVYHIIENDKEDLELELIDDNNENIEEEDEEQIYIDDETEKKVEIIRKTAETIELLSNQYTYNSNLHMLEVQLDNECVLQLFDYLKQLNCKTVEIDVFRKDISSGHAAYMDMCSQINYARKSPEIQTKKNVILLIDEGDIYLHPEKQLAYIDYLLKLLQILYCDKKIQIVITSNSPFIVSDVQKANILFLERDEGRINIAQSMIEDTFAANINNLLLDSFFVKKGLIGQYAHRKVNSIINEIREGKVGENQEDLLAVIDIIGEPIIKRKLEEMLLGNLYQNAYQKQLMYYEAKVMQLKKRLENKKQ